MTKLDLTALSAQQNLVLGVACGTIEVCCLQPMLYCKNSVQQGVPSLRLWLQRACVIQVHPHATAGVSSGVPACCSATRP